MLAQAQETAKLQSKGEEVRFPPSHLLASMLPESVEPDIGKVPAASSTDPPAFLELFAGAGGLSAAVSRLGLPVHQPMDVRSDQGGIIELAVGDLLDPQVFAHYFRLARKGRIRWLHGGPPCKTFTMARRRDRFGSAKVLRSDRHPEGLPGVKDQWVRTANELVKRFAKLARVVHRCGGFWSVENPERSYLWSFGPMVALAKLQGASFIVGDQCCHGGLYAKPTGWLTTAPFLQVLAARCPGPPAHPRHPPLQGWATAPDGRQCWLTELAAEYPQDLCDNVAAEYARFALAPPRSARRLVFSTSSKFADPLDATRRQAREADNATCIGGLRDPTKSLHKVTGWYPVGVEVARALREVLAANPADMDALLSAIGNPEGEAHHEELITKARTAIAEVLQVALPPKHQTLWAEALSKMVNLSHDPDVSVPEWLGTSTPLGIARPIPCHGIFPTLSPQEAEQAARHYAPISLSPVFDNYASYTEYREQADAELDREVHAGFVQMYPTKAALVQGVGPCILSKVGVLVKTKNAKAKVRLIHDLSRSGVNHRIRLPERVVLPRLSDVVHNIVRFLKSRSASYGVECAVLDFSDAFKQLHVDLTEQGFLTGTCTQGFFAYLRVLFGVVSGPLVWGRVAACIVRASQSLAIHDNTEEPAIRDNPHLALACFVDDPFITVAGSSAERKMMLAVVLLFWLVLGFRLAWKKGHVGTSVPWIGAQVEVDSARGAVVVTIPAERRGDMLLEVRSLLSQPTFIWRKALREFTGRAEWVAGLLPQLKPFVRMLWAALASTSIGPDKVWVKQVRLPLTWLEAFFAMTHGPLTRVTYADPPGTVPVIMFDASTIGGGALLWVVKTAEVICPDALQATPPGPIWLVRGIPSTRVSHKVPEAIARARHGGKHTLFCWRSGPGPQLSSALAALCTLSVMLWVFFKVRSCSGLRIR